MGPRALLALLLLAGTTAGKHPDEDDRLNVTRTPAEGEGFDELKWMYNSLRTRMQQRMAGGRPRTAGVNNVAVDPLFLDLDNLDKFNDISFPDTTTFSSSTTTTEAPPSTQGPVVVGVDSQGRSILRFVSNWENELAPFTTEATTLPTTTTTTTPATTTTETTTTTTTTTTEPTTTTTTMRTTTTEATTTTTTEPTTSTTTTTTTTPVPTSTEVFPTLLGSFNGENEVEENLDATPEIITIAPFVQPTPEPQDVIWWTPKPSFLGMSSMLSIEENSKIINKHTTEWEPMTMRARTSAPVTASNTTTTTSTTATTPWTTSTTTTEAIPETAQPPIQKGARGFLSRLHKVAEQTVLNELELLAGSMDMKELVSELRGEQRIPQVLDPLQTETTLVAKRKTLAQLEMLNRLANRKDELQQLITTQRQILSQAKGSRTKIVSGRTFLGTDETDALEVNDALKQARSFEPAPIPVTAATYFPPVTPRKYRSFKKRQDSGSRHRRPRLHHIMAIPPRRPDRMVDSETPTSVAELTHLLEKEMKDAQSQVLSEEMRHFCSQAMCTFEKGDTCRYESSYDELTRRRRTQQRKRSTREAPPLYVIRSWSNWVGQQTPMSTRIDRAPHFTTRNSRFAGVFLEPQQLATLSLSVSVRRPFTIRFRGWEATSGLRLRVCCDDFCPFSTDLGRSRRRWRRLSVDCPSDTRQIAFECENMGSRRGVCGIDDVFVAADSCPALFDGPSDP